MGGPGDRRRWATGWAWGLALNCLCGQSFAQTPGQEISADALPPDVAAFFGAVPEEPRAPIPRIVEAIEVIGNDKTARTVITGFLSLSPGELVDESAIEESRIRLLSTGFFRSVEFRLRRGSSRGWVLLVVEVVERNTLRIENLAFGFGPGHAPFAAIGLAESNFLGRGVSVSGAIAIGEDRHGGELRFFVPALSGTPIQVAGSALWLVGKESISSQLGFDGPQLGYERAGGSLAFGFSSGPAQRISLIYRLESITVDRLPNLDPPVLRQAPSVLGDHSLLSTLALTWERDTRDDALAPTRGSRLALGVEVGTSLLGSDYEHSKYTGEALSAMHVVNGQALVLHVFGGLIQGRAPFFSQFFRRDHAYFSYDGNALPRAVQLNFGENNDYDDVIVDAGAEYDVPIYSNPTGLLSRVILYGAASFTATGSLDESQDDLGGRGAFGTFPITADVGLKLDSVIGRFTLSGAYALDLAL